ncbi:hypothetical protein [Mucilaginibacter flavidus]|uniref:hypothetical protein n=1 Tax=Mucilaginibacter flavidus TaxID=2949309 RepID=UPI002092F145|nr:hypothetical protein [Mucilaginibacter flavidus]MCO5948101.1 hypothetical protein [Mucilaginibacter flavidus]
MKRFITIVLVALSLHVFGQSYPVKNIKISLPSNPDANTLNWGNSNSFTISAMAGEIGPDVQVKLLAVIKKDGVITCGAYNSLSAPKVSFDKPVKTWNGKDAAALLMEGCTLPPGEYELSVQFFGYRDGKTATLSEEKIKKFSVNAGEVNNGKKGVSLNIGGLGITFGGRQQAADACGTITSFTKVACAGMDGQTGLQQYAITVKMVNRPVQKDKACTFILNSVSALSKGTTVPGGRQSLPLKIAPNDSAAYTFIYTPVAISSLDAKFNISGNWNGDKNSGIEMQPAMTLQPCAVCGCGNWTNLMVDNTAVAASLEFECGNNVQLPWKCGQAFSFTSTYQCAGAVKCDAVTAWEIQKDGVRIKIGNGGIKVTDSFIPTGNGLYTLTLNATCNGVKCPPCTYSIVVVDCKIITPPPVSVPEVTTTISVTPVIVVVKNKDTAKSAPTGDKYYYDLDTDPTHTTTEIYDNTLNVQFTNNYASVENIKVNIYNSSSGALLRPAASKNAKLISTTGLNRMTVNLNDYKLEPGRPYYFMVSVFSHNYHLNFKVMGDHEK